MTGVAWVPGSKGLFRYRVFSRTHLRSSLTPEEGPSCYTYYDEISLQKFYEKELVIEFIKSYKAFCSKVDLFDAFCTATVYRNL